MKRRLSLLLALLLCLSLFACGKTPEEPPAEPPAQQDPVSQPEPTPEPEPEPQPEPEPAPEPQPSSPAVEVDASHYSHQVIAAAGAAPVITATFLMPEAEGLSKITAYYESVKTDLFTIYSSEAGDALLQMQNMGENFLPWTMEMTFEVQRNDGTVLSILRELYESRGGVHPAVVHFAETFEVESQGRLLLGNLFTVPEEEYLARLRDLILAQMDKREGEEGVYYFESAREQLLNLLDPMDFALTEDSLLIFFDHYALAPYAAGPQYFYLPYSELSDILDTRWVKE